MLTDKQSLILCTIVVVGFVVSGILNVFDNLLISGTILILFLIVIVNLLVTKKTSEVDGENTNSDS